MRTNNINFQNISYINDTGIPDENNETIIPAFTAFEVFPRFSTVLSGTTSNVEVNFDAMFSGTNQWNINNSYAIDVYVTIYDKENSLNSKIYKTLKNVPTGININNTEYWQDETSAYFEIKQDGKAYHKYINKISKCYTHAIKIKSTFNPIQQNVIIDWGDGTFINLSNAVELADNEELSNVLGSEKDGSKDVIVKNPKQLTENQFGKNDSYSYYCYHDYMPAMVRDGIVQIITNEDETITAKQGLPDKPYKILIYGTTYFGIGQDMGITLTRRIEPKDYITQERTIVPSFSHVLISRIFDDDLPFYPTTATTLASFANGAKNLLYINIPKYFNGFDTCINTYEMFERCSNLQYCNGFNNKLRFNSLRGMCRMFNGCKNLIKCDIKLAKNVVDHNIDSVHDGNKGIFTDCNNLAVDLLSLLPLDGFSSRYMNLIETFKNCKSLDTTNEHTNYIKELLWKDTFKIWKTYNGSDNIDKTTATFYGCNQLNKKMNFIPDGWKNNKKYIDPDLIVVDIPKLNDLTYTGDEQTIGITSNDEYIVDDNSELTKTNVGTYKVILRIKNGYIWSDKTFENKEIEWSITKAKNEWEIPPELNKTSWREDEEAGKVINIGKAKFGDIKVTLDGEEYDINNPLPIESSDKPYELKFIVDETTNYEGLTYTITFEIIDRPDISEPDITDKTYTGNPHYIITVDDTFTVTGTTFATDVGNYSFTITPKDGYEWPDNTDVEKTFNWSITQATNEWTTKPYISKTEWIEGDTSVTLTNGVAKFGGNAVMMLDDKEINELPTEAGEYMLTFMVAGSKNYTSISLTIPITILEKEEEKPLTMNDIQLAAEYGTVVRDLGEDEDEVAVVFKNSDVDNIQWTVPGTITNVQFLAVAGGGGGGGAANYDNTSPANRGGAGGGGGGVVTGIIPILNKNSILEVVVGAGGAGGSVAEEGEPGTRQGAGRSLSGESTMLYINDEFYLSAYGGGRDQGHRYKGGHGGSNGGGRITSQKDYSGWKETAVNTNYITNYDTYGNLGGVAGGSSAKYGSRAAGGGGGAMEVGGDGDEGTSNSKIHGGKGGEGLSSDITGTMTVYGSGGGGGSGTHGFGNVGGTGAGDGGCWNSAYGNKEGTSATPNQGGGGGGAGENRGGGNGGSGIFVLRFKVKKTVEEPLCFEAETPNAKLSFNKIGSPQEAKIITSVDGVSWSPYEFGDEITLTNIGDKVYFKSEDNNENETFYIDENNYYRFNSYSTADKIKVSGNINTLLKSDELVLDLTGRDNCFNQIFSGFIPLTQAPVLPATILSKNCYSGMFKDCSSLTTPPQMSSTIPAENCYYQMFSGCTSLSSGPIMYDSEIIDDCYNLMFQNCKALETISFLNLEKDIVSTKIANYDNLSSPFIDTDKIINITCKNGILVISTLGLMLTNPINNSTISLISEDMRDLLSLSNDELAEHFVVAHTSESQNEERLELKKIYQDKNSVPVELQWIGKGNSEYTVSLWRTYLDTEETPYFTTVTKNNSVKIYDLEIGRNYRWSVSDNFGEKNYGNFFTETSDVKNGEVWVPRIIRSRLDEGGPSTCSNGRDLGGSTVSFTEENDTTSFTNMRVKQGLIYRSGELEYCNTSSNEKILYELTHLKNDLHIKTELDIRTNNWITTYYSSKQLGWKNNEPFTNILVESTIGDGVKRVAIGNVSNNLKFSDINGVFKNQDGQTVSQNRQVLWVAFNEIYKSISKNEPIIFHCSHGKDRTGLLSIVILGYLGVPVDVITKDFILAWATNQDAEFDISELNTFKTNIAKLNGNTTGNLSQNDFYNFLRECGTSAGLQTTDVESILNHFKDLMLEVVETKITEPPKSLNVLTIGNSFSQPLASSTALPLAVKKIGKKINYGHLSEGGLSLDKINTYIQNGKTLEFKTFFTADDGTITENKSNTSIVNALKKYEWDIVTIQQRSIYSHDEEKYQTYVNNIINKIHEIAPNAKIVWHLTWSFDRFASTVDNTGFNFNGSIEKRDNMYDNIVNTYNNKVKKFVDDVIPVGYAIQLYRYRLPVIEPEEDFTSKDHYHLNYLSYSRGNSGGTYLQTICWCYKLFGDAPTIKQFYPYMMDGDTYLLDETEINRLRQCAIDACNNADITKYGQGTIDFNWTVKFLDSNNNVIDTQTVLNGECIVDKDIINNTSNNTSNNWICSYRVGVPSTNTDGGVVTKTVDMTLDEIKTKRIYDNITFKAVIKAVNPLTFTSTGNSTISLNKYGSPDPISLTYQIDDNEPQEYTINQQINLTDGQTLKMYATNENDIISDASASLYGDHYYFSMTGKIAASGNLNTLLKADGSVLDLIGRKNCYYKLFSGCTALTQAPELPATTLTDYCYYSMFEGCTSLTAAPELPATTLTDYCYSNMFQNCTSLTQAPKLPATTLALDCCRSMFKNCESLKQAPELPSKMIAIWCYYGMFEGCTSLTAAPELPATWLDNFCYMGMFSGCTSLTAAPELPATKLASNCYQGMFQGCSQLNNIIVNFSNWDTEEDPTSDWVTTDWVRGVASTGTFTCPTTLSEKRGVSFIPEGWTVIRK